MNVRQRFVTEQWLPYPSELVFAFFANPANLLPLMPAWQKARIDAVDFRPPHPSSGGEIPGEIYAGSGTELAITARPLPFSPLRGTWLARIENFRWNEGFCDVQIKGPFRYWRHCHTVKNAKDPFHGSGTLVRDEVEYELPTLLDVLLLNKIVVVPQLRVLFRYRQKQAETMMKAHMNRP